MKFRKIRLALLRLKLDRINFYEDVSIIKTDTKLKAGKEKIRHLRRIAKKAIAEWMFNMQYFEAISIEKFKYLFSELEEVVFPIDIVDVYYSKFGSFNINIIDSEGKKYCMSRRSRYENTETYIIGRRNSPLEPLIDRTFYYAICENKGIVLKKTGIMQLKPDGTNTDVVVNFSYLGDRTTEAELSLLRYMEEIKITYQTRNKEFDKKVLHYLIKINEEYSYYYDSLPILKWLISIMPNEKVSLSITTKMPSKNLEKMKDVLIGSEIVVKNGIMQKYTKTEIISEEELQIIQKIFAKDLMRFIEENS